MSAFLLGLGFKADMGTQSRKLVLLKLIDACHDDGTKIFPALETVAKAAQCSKRQVQREIGSFLSVGLLRIVRAGGRGPGHTSEYVLDLDVLGDITHIGWDSYAALIGSPDSQNRQKTLENKGDTMSPIEKKGDTGDTLRVTPATHKGDNKSPPTPYYPLSNPSTARESVREASEDRKDAEDPKKVDAAFWEFVKDWPGFGGLGKERARKLWHSMSADDRAQAVAGYAGWRKLLKRDRKDHVPTPQTYFRNRLWLSVPDDMVADRPERDMAKPFGKLWMATRFVELLSPPKGRIAGLTQADRNQIAAGVTTEAEIMRKRVQQMGWSWVNTMHERARERQGANCPLALEGVAAAFLPVHRDSGLMQAWAAEHERRGWPFFDPPEWTYFPATTAGGDDAAAVRAALDELDAATSDYRKRGNIHDAA